MTLQFRLLAGLALASLISCAAFSADPPAPVKTPPSKTDLHRLANKELLGRVDNQGRACHWCYLRRIMMEATWTKARKLRAVFS